MPNVPIQVDVRDTGIDLDDLRMRHTAALPDVGSVPAHGLGPDTPREIVMVRRLDANQRVLAAGGLAPARHGSWWTGSGGRSNAASGPQWRVVTKPAPSSGDDRWPVWMPWQAPAQPALDRPSGTNWSTHPVSPTRSGFPKERTRAVTRSREPGCDQSSAGARRSALSARAWAIPAARWMTISK